MIRILPITREGEQGITKTARDADLAARYDEVSMTIAELRDFLKANDARWEVFGLNIPADAEGVPSSPSPSPPPAPAASRPPGPTPCARTKPSVATYRPCST
jgi:hypothetical protein